MFFKLHLGTCEQFEEQGGHAKGVGHRNVLIALLVRSWLSMFFSKVRVHTHCTSYDFQRIVFLEYLKQVLLPYTLMPFFVAAFLPKVRYV